MIKEPKIVIVPDDMDEVAVPYQKPFEGIEEMPLTPDYEPVQIFYVKKNQRDGTFPALQLPDGSSVIIRSENQLKLI